MTVGERLAGLIDGLPGDRVLVAFDGSDAAGKTTLAREVADLLARPAICASVDGWHHPREVRLRRGFESPEGYYLDSFDLDALVGDLLTPFRRGASYVPTSRFDHRADTPVRADQHVAERAALLFDGVFLLRQELVTQWDLRVYVHVPEEITLSRALVRGLDLFGSEAAVRHRYERRYLPDRLSTATARRRGRPRTSSSTTATGETPSSSAGPTAHRATPFAPATCGMSGRHPAVPYDSVASG